MFSFDETKVMTGETVKYVLYIVLAELWKYLCANMLILFSGPLLPVSMIYFTEPGGLGKIPRGHLIQPHAQSESI